MAQDNPLLGFFEGIGAGMEAGQRRRTLMERARQGEISPQDVPSLGMTALMGAVRAATPASTRLAQDQLQMQMADYALRKQIQDDKTATAQLVEYNKLAKERLEAEQEKNNALTYSNSISQLDRYASNNDWNAFDSQMPPDGFDVTLIDKWSAEKRRIADDYGRQNFKEVAGMKEDLSTEGYTPETLSRMSQGSIRVAHEVSMGRFKNLDGQLQYIPMDQRATIRGHILTGTPEEKQQAWATLDNASFEAQSSLGKIQQDIKKYRALGGADNLAVAKQLEGYAAGLVKGEEAPSYTITTDENGKTTVQVGPASQLEDKDLKLSIVSEIPQSLAMINRLQRSVAPGNVGIPGSIKSAIGRYGSLLGETASYLTGANIQVPIFEDVKAIRMLRADLVQNIRKSLRADVGPISNFEQAGLDRITEGLDGVTSAAELRVVLDQVEQLLKTSQFIKAHAIGEVPLLLRNYGDTESEFLRAVLDLNRLKETGEIPPADLQRYMKIISDLNPELAIKILGRG